METLHTVYMYLPSDLWPTCTYMTGMMSDLKAGVFCQQNHSTFPSLVWTAVAQWNTIREKVKGHNCVSHTRQQSP